MCVNRDLVQIPRAQRAAPRAHGTRPVDDTEGDELCENPLG